MTQMMPMYGFQGLHLTGVRHEQIHEEVSVCRFYNVIVENCLVLLIENQMEENEIIHKIRKITTCNSDLSHLQFWNWPYYFVAL